jgi:hypothetical protein
LQNSLWESHPQDGKREKNISSFQEENKIGILYEYCTGNPHQDLMQKLVFNLFIHSGILQKKKYKIHQQF